MEGMVFQGNEMENSSATHVWMIEDGSNDSLAISGAGVDSECERVYITREVERMNDVYVIELE